MTWLTALLSVFAAIGGAGGLVSLAQIGPTKRRILAQAQQTAAKADETVAGTVRTLVGGAADLVQPLQRALDAAELRADRINLQLREAWTEVDGLRREVQRIRTAIHEPAMTLDRLRAMVPVDVQDNGRSS